MLLESVPGTAGIIIPPKDYFKGVREITKKYSILMITDEVMAGFGRTCVLASWRPLCERCFSAV